jgi:hypothetical protein
MVKAVGKHFTGHMGVMSGAKRHQLDEVDRSIILNTR